jgi:alpha/beta hydrolase fold
MTQPGSDELSRRRLVALAGLSAGAVLLAPNAVFAEGMEFGSGRAQPQNPPPNHPGKKTAFSSLKEIDGGVLRVGYAEDGPPEGPSVILLHGWPYDIHSYIDVAPLLAESGYRVIIPYLRGYGPTRFLSDGTERNGQQPASRPGCLHQREQAGVEPRCCDERGRRNQAPSLH